MKRVRFLLRSVSGEVDKRAPLGLPTLNRAAVSGGGGPPLVPQASHCFSHALLSPPPLTKDTLRLPWQGKSNADAGPAEDNDDDWVLVG